MPHLSLNERQSRTTMPRHVLDAIDLRLLAALQENGRLTIVELSRLAVLTAPPCHRRLRKLEAAGFIRGYHAKLDAKKLGHSVGAMIAVGLASQSRTDIVKFEEAVRKWPLVRECHALNGEVDFLLRCVATKIGQLSLFITDTLLTAPNVKTVRTYTITRVVKCGPGVPIETAATIAGVTEGARIIQSPESSTGLTVYAKRWPE